MTPLKGPGSPGRFQKKGTTPLIGGTAKGEVWGQRGLYAGLYDQAQAASSGIGAVD